MVDMTKGMGSTGDGDWMTPEWMMDLLEREFGNFDLDPCGQIDSPSYFKCKHSYLLHDAVSEHEEERHSVKDGLKADWTGKVYVNPPYGRGMDDWFKKAIHECESGNCELAVFLVPARSDTEWWHNYAMKSYEVCFLNGRVPFVHKVKKSTSPAFPSVLISFRGGKRSWGHPQMTSLSVRKEKRGRKTSTMDPKVAKEVKDAFKKFRRKK